MFVKAQILTAAILSAGTLFAGVPGPAAPVSNMVFVAFDVETTGFSPKNDRIVEIGAVRFRGNGEIQSATNWLVNPGMPVPFQATEVHGITTEMVAGAPAFKEIFPQFSAFCGDGILLAHNAPFDSGFLRAELERAGIPAPAFLVGDTLPLFRRWFPLAGSYSLEALSSHLGLTADVNHRGGADAVCLMNVFNAGIKSCPAIQFRQLEHDAGGFQRLDGGKH